MTETPEEQSARGCTRALRVAAYRLRRDLALGFAAVPPELAAMDPDDSIDIGDDHHQEIARSLEGAFAALGAGVRDRIDLADSATRTRTRTPRESSAEFAIDRGLWRAPVGLATHGSEPDEISGPSDMPTSCFIEAGFAAVFRRGPEPSSPQALLPADPAVVRTNVGHSAKVGNGSVGRADDLTRAQERGRL